MQDIYARYRESLRLGHQLAAEGKFAEALGYYQTAAELAGERAVPHIAVAGMLLRLGRQQDALAAYDRALTYEPDNLDALGGRAAALLAAGRRGDAEAVRKQIALIRGEASGPEKSPSGVEAAPVRGAEAHAVAAEQARLAGHLEAAMDALLAESDEHIRDDHFDAALDACLRALALDSSATRVHLEIVRIYFVRGWKHQAVERATLLDRLLTLDPDPVIRAGLVSLVATYAADEPRLAHLLSDGGASPAGA